MIEVIEMYTHMLSVCKENMLIDGFYIATHF